MGNWRLDKAGLKNGRELTQNKNRIVREKAQAVSGKWPQTYRPVPEVPSTSRECDVEKVDSGAHPYVGGILVSQV